MLGSTKPWAPRGECWSGSCPCCRRPVQIDFVAKEGHAAHVVGSTEAAAQGKNAYVINLWGSSRAYVLGAMVLGHSLRETGTKHSLVCLHTDEVPPGFIKLLARIWDCRLVEHVDACGNALSWPDNPERFEKVFTKLRGMSLVDFEKILVMDIDLLVLSNIDNLFDLSAPAALRRGMAGSYGHGDALDGRSFFLGTGAGKWSWGQGTGINAGVMLWRPNKAEYSQMLEEVQDPSHPEHVRGNGPEQDYLSRFWADAPWTNLSVEYNFQLHQMFFALNPFFIGTSDRIKCTEDPAYFPKIVHFSGEPMAKPWHRVLHSSHAHLWPDRTRDAEYAELFAEEFRGYWLWVKRDRSAWAKAEEDKKWNGPMALFSLGVDGVIYAEDEGSGKLTPAAMPESAMTAAMGFLGSSLSAWFDTFERLQSELGIDLVAALEAAHPSSQQSGSEQERSWKPTWFAQPLDAASASAPTPLRSKVVRPHTQFYNKGGWMHERVSGTYAPLDKGYDDAVFAKASVACCGRDGARFVIFSESGHDSGCSDTFFSEAEGGSGPRGVFVKVAGRSARAFSLADGDIDPLRIWADGVSDGVLVLMAVVGLEAKLVSDVLAALARLGSPQGPVDSKCCALAAAGCTGTGASWGSAHASTDVAYASVPMGSGFDR